MRGCGPLRPSEATESEMGYACEDPRLGEAGVIPTIEASLKVAASVLKTCWSFKKDVKLYGTNSVKSFSINKSAKKRTQIKQGLSAKTCSKYTKLPQLRHANGRLSRGTEKLLRAARGRFDCHKKMLNYTERTQLTPLPSINVPKKRTQIKGKLSRKAC